MGHRLRQHQVAKEKWWDFVVAFVINNADHQLSKADIKYLENLMYQRAQQSQRMQLFNGNTPHKSFVAEGRKYDLAEVFENIDLLLRAFDLPVFAPAPSTLKALKLMPIATSAPQHPKMTRQGESDRMFWFDGRGSQARATYTPEGNLLVHRGSRLTPKAPAKSFNPALVRRLERAGVIKNNVFVDDYLFTSPSTAGSVIYKARCNGWTMWHDQAGKTLDQRFRT